MAIYNGKDLYTLAALGLADLLAPAFGRCKARVDERFTLVNVALVAKRIGQLRENLAQHFLLGAGKVPDARSRARVHHDRYRGAVSLATLSMQRA
jgi:hypothetical protein